MLRDTHKAFAEKIAEELNFTAEKAWIFVDGSLGPDTHGDFPHDTGKEAKMLFKLNAARDLYHLNDENAYGELGNSLHYLQDKWVSNLAYGNQVEIIGDDQLLNLINQPNFPKENAEEYASILDSLFTLRDNGIDSWFNHKWGIWHRDYLSCVLVFADILELMLPTLQPDFSIISDEEKLREYVGSGTFRKAVKEGFLASIITNYLDPKLQGYPAAMYCLASINPPMDNRNFAVDFNIAYRLSLEIARYTIGKPELFQFKDSWTHKVEKNKHMSLSLVIPQYHLLITKLVEEVHSERIWNFDDESRKFLDNWPKIEKSVAENKRSNTWKLLLSGLIEILAN